MQTAWLAGSSAAITRVRAQIFRAAPYFRTALLMGERDCGEETAARILHQLSPLSHRPFVAVTSAEVQRFLGAHSFPDAVALQGMLYLSYPESLPRSAQTALLRLIRKRGTQGPRIVAFAERGLRPPVNSGCFSAQLAESLGALRIALPPLCDRREDIPALLTEILRDVAAQSGITLPQLAPDLLDAAMKLPWRGNFSQLHSAAEGLTRRVGNGPLHALDLESELGLDRCEIRMIRLDDVIQEHIRAVLFACDGNKLRAAKVLGVSRSTLYRMLGTETYSFTSAPLKVG
ncbi:MAG TPA: sigma 54-interacting transcriptional regulator [Acidobacteriaceae bacterium]